MITKEEFFGTMSWNNFSVARCPKNKFMLILLCQDADRAARLYGFITINKPALTVLKDSRTGLYTFEIKLRSTGFVIEYHTDKTVHDYPPLSWLSEGHVQLMTTGIVLKNKQISAFKPFVFENMARLN